MTDLDICAQHDKAFDRPATLKVAFRRGYVEALDDVLSDVDEHLRTANHNEDFLEEHALLRLKDDIEGLRQVQEVLSRREREASEADTARRRSLAGSIAAEEERRGRA